MSTTFTASWRTCSSANRGSSTLSMICNHGHGTSGVPRESDDGLMCLLVFYRCEDMVDVRRLKMLQMVQLFKCEEDASQVRA